MERPVILQCVSTMGSRLSHLSLVQGYAQYFHAWAGSGQTFVAYNEAVVAAASYARSHNPVPSHRYVVAAADEAPVASYLLSVPGVTVPVIAPTGLASLPEATGSTEFLITAAARNASLSTLSQKYPGGKLKPHNSAFNDDEIFYQYGITK